MTRHGAKDATNDPDKVREWWTQRPDANVGIATGPSGLTVLDVDHGFANADDVRFFSELHGLPETYTVRTGRRPDFGVQFYFQGGGLKSIPWADAERGLNGDIRSATGYVLAEGSYHPSGAFYEALVEAPIASEPAFVRGLRTAAKTATDDGLITEHRNTTLTSIAGKLRNAGLSAAALEVSLLQVNADRCVPPLGEDEVRRIAANASAWALPETEPAVIIGGRAAGEPEPVDWRTHYHTFDEMDSAPELTFLIDGIMHVESITGLAAPAGQRKSLIALNVAHSLCTGEPLFGQFEVVQKPARVLYLCPEMGMRSFRKRARSIGLMPYVGDTFFCRTMNIEDAGNPLGLNDLLPEELDGAVVIVDTAIRFIQGDESKSQDMREFAKTLYRLIPHGDTPGAAAVLVLYHSGKGVVKESNELTLENVLRGSSELGAALTCCWGTKLQEQEDSTASIFKAVSYLKCVKPRDFEDDPRPFEVTCDDTCKMTYVQNEGVPVLKVRSQGNRANKDGMDEAAVALIAAQPDMSGMKLRALLAEHGLKRSASWINLRKSELKGNLKIKAD